MLVRVDPVAVAGQTVTVAAADSLLIVLPDILQAGVLATQSAIPSVTSSASKAKRLVLRMTWLWL
jgi:hypothetical protein